MMPRRAPLLGPVAAYCAVWALCLAAFWVPASAENASGSFALAYSLVVIWGALPAMTFVTALRVARCGAWGWRAWLLVPALGLAYMLFCWLTFPLANTLSFGRLNELPADMLALGAVLAAAGLLAGRVARRMGEKGMGEKGAR